MSLLNVKQSTFNKSIGNNNSFLSLFLDVPFFFNNNEGSFYRFEASVYNFLKEPSLKNYSLEYSMNLKVNFKILKSISFGNAHYTLNKMTKPANFYSYLFANSFQYATCHSFFNRGPLFSEDFSSFTNNVGDYFFNEKIFSTNLYKAQALLSDACVEALLPVNRLNYILHNSYFNIDTFISSYSSLSSYFDFDTSNSFIFNIRFPRQNLFMLGSRKRTTSFFVNSFDSLAIFSSFSFFLNN